MLTLASTTKARLSVRCVYAREEGDPSPGEQRKRFARNCPVESVEGFKTDISGNSTRPCRRLLTPKLTVEVKIEEKLLWSWTVSDKDTHCPKD